MLNPISRASLMALALVATAPALAIDGDRDLTFGNGTGVLLGTFDDLIGADSGSSLNKVVLTADGKLVAVGGMAPSADDRDCTLVRALPDGQGLDAGFANGGRRVLAPNFGGLRRDSCNGLGVHADGTVMVGGNAQTATNINTGVVMRVLPSGAIDTGFFGDGILRMDTELGLTATQINVNPVLIDHADRALVLGTFTRNDGSTRGLVLRFTPAGALDPDFGVNGRVELADFNPPTLFALAIGEDSQHRLLITGASASAFPNDQVTVIFRLLEDGSADISFGSGMTVIGGGGRGFDTRCDSSGLLTIDAQDRLITTCAAVTNPRPQPQIIRLLPNGQSDQDFGAGGFVTPAYEYNTAGNAISGGGELAMLRFLVTADGKILNVGSYRPSDTMNYGALDAAVQRLNSNGLVDRSFGRNGAMQYRLEGGPIDIRLESANDAVLDAQGRLIVAGARNFNGANEYFLMRLQTAPPPEHVFLDGFE